jgi:hypothetical protein
MPVVLAVAAEPNTGWGGPLALVITVAVFYAFTQVYKRWKSVDSPSPTDGPKALDGVKSQATAGGDPVDPTKVVAVRKGAQLEEFVGVRLANRDRPAQIIREAKRLHRVSEATVKRAIRRVRGGGQP